MKIIVKCQKCGMEYEMPAITTDEVIMEDCPVCKDLEKSMKELLKE